MTKKFWCHYIGSDGNTPKRRNIELTNLADLIPAIGDNTNCATPLWYERVEGDYNQVYHLVYAQLSENVAVRVIEAPTSRPFYDMIGKSDEELEADWKQWLEKYIASEPDMPEERKEKQRELAIRRIAEDKEARLKHLEFVKQIQNYTGYLIDSNPWINCSVIRANEEVLSPYLPVLQEMRRKALEERDRREQERREENRRRAEEEARRKAEEEAKEQERLTQEAEKFKQGESISGSDVVDLCRRYGIAIHLRTVHNLQQVIANINGKHGTCQYYRTRGKRRPHLDGCYKTAGELYQYLQTH